VIAFLRAGKLRSFWLRGETLTTDVRELTCIECPTGCTITVSVEVGRAVLVEGFGCRRGHDYAVTEVERPVRLITTTVPTSGLSLRMVPVRTTRPIPRSMRTEAMKQLRSVKVDRPVKVGDAIISNLLGLGVDVVATREVN
jgi:CxxC motif-containing protein